MLSAKSTYLHMKIGLKCGRNLTIVSSCRGKKSVFKGPIDTIYLSFELTSKSVYVYEDDSTAMHKR